MTSPSDQTAPAAHGLLVEGGEAEKIEVSLEDFAFTGELLLPKGARGLVLMVGGEGCVHESPRQKPIERRLAEVGIGSLAFHLLTAAEERMDRQNGELRYDLEFLTRRLLLVTQWTLLHPGSRGLGLGYFASGTYAAAALIAAAQLGRAVRAVLALSGRADFAADSLLNVASPTLLVVGENDEPVHRLNRLAYGKLVCVKKIAVVPGAGHLFEENGSLQRVAELAADWYGTYLPRPKQR